MKAELWLQERANVNWTNALCRDRNCNGFSRAKQRLKHVSSYVHCAAVVVAFGVLRLSE